MFGRQRYMNCKILISIILFQKGLGPTKIKIKKIHEGPQIFMYGPTFMFYQSIILWNGIESSNLPNMDN